MGRGIDFKGVNLVINYDFPNSAISYIHRIGKLTKNIKLQKFLDVIGIASYIEKQDESENFRDIRNKD